MSKLGRREEMQWHIFFRRHNFFTELHNIGPAITWIILGNRVDNNLNSPGVHPDTWLKVTHCDLGRITSGKSGATGSAIACDDDAPAASVSSASRLTRPIFWLSSAPAHHSVRTVPSVQLRLRWNMVYSPSSHLPLFMIPGRKSDSEGLDQIPRQPPAGKFAKRNVIFIHQWSTELILSGLPASRGERWSCNVRSDWTASLRPPPNILRRLGFVNWLPCTNET